VIKRLTVIATIGVPLTVITSYYGMNFEFPEYHYARPAVYVLALLIGSAVATLAVLKWKRWW
jgi:magnesium transporter